MEIQKAIERPLVAVAIVNWNGKHLMQRYLPDVLKYTTSSMADIVVADNGSTDNSVEWLTTTHPTVKQINFSKNYGFAEGYNRTIELLSGYKYIVLLNSDATTSAGWLQPLVEYMEANPNTAACQPKLLWDVDRDMFEYAGAAGGYIDKNGYPFCRGRVFGSVERDNGQYDNEIKRIFWATGAALFIRREDYITAGGLDASFFAHMEEIDLCWRLNSLGKDIVVIPQSVVYHYGGGTLASNNPRKTYLNFRNNLFMLYKNLPKSISGRVIFRRKVLDGIAALMFIAKLQFKNVAAIARAHRHFERDKHRYNSQPTTNIMSQFAECKRNIIVDYYLKGRKVF